MDSGQSWFTTLVSESFKNLMTATLYSKFLWWQFNENDMYRRMQSIISTKKFYIYNRLHFQRVNVDFDFEFNTFEL